MSFCLVAHESDFRSAIERVCFRERDFYQEENDSSAFQVHRRHMTT